MVSKDYYTYSFLLRKSEYDRHFCRSELGEGMASYWFSNVSSPNKEHFIVDDNTREVYELVNEHGVLVGFSPEDIDFTRLEGLEHNGNAYTMTVRYGFGVEAFHNGVAMVSWTLYPDGQYFADEDGYGAEDNDELTVYAFIDRHCRVLVPFRDMTFAERKEMRLLAEEKCRNGVI